MYCFAFAWDHFSLACHLSTDLIRCISLLRSIRSFSICIKSHDNFQKCFQFNSFTRYCDSRKIAGVEGLACKRHCFANRWFHYVLSYKCKLAPREQYAGTQSIRRSKKASLKWLWSLRKRGEMAENLKRRVASSWN